MFLIFYWSRYLNSVNYFFRNDLSLIDFINLKKKFLFFNIFFKISFINLKKNMFLVYNILLNQKNFKFNTFFQNYFVFVKYLILKNKINVVYFDFSSSLIKHKLKKNTKDLFFSKELLLLIKSLTLNIYSLNGLAINNKLNFKFFIDLENYFLKQNNNNKFLIFLNLIKKNFKKMFFFERKFLFLLFFKLKLNLLFNKLKFKIINLVFFTNILNFYNYSIILKNLFQFFFLSYLQKIKKFYYLIFFSKILNKFILKNQIHNYFNFIIRIFNFNLKTIINQNNFRYPYLKFLLLYFEHIDTTFTKNKLFFFNKFKLYFNFKFLNDKLLNLSKMLNKGLSFKFKKNNKLFKQLSVLVKNTARFRLNALLSRQLTKRIFLYYLRQFRNRLLRIKFLKLKEKFTNNIKLQNVVKYYSELFFYYRFFKLEYSFFGFCTANRSLKNYFFTITDFKGCVIVSYNMGTFTKRKLLDRERLRIAPVFLAMGDMAITKCILKKIFILSVKVKVPLFFWQLKHTLYRLIHRDIRLRFIIIYYIIGHNGIRLKKLRRV